METPRLIHSAVRFRQINLPFRNRNDRGPTSCISYSAETVQIPIPVPTDKSGNASNDVAQCYNLDIVPSYVVSKTDSPLSPKDSVSYITPLIFFLCFN